MFEPGARIRGEVDVIAAEDLVMAFELVDLHEKGSVTDIEFQGIVYFGFCQLFFCQEGIGRRAESEVGKFVNEGKAVESTIHEQ
jgi:hypothetical protein